MYIIINTPFISSLAGVSNHYLGLKPYFSNEVKYNQFITTNYIKRRIRWRKLHKTLRIIAFFCDMLKFVLLIMLYKKPNVLLNPSFGERSIKRDLVYLRVAKLFKCKVAVFFHGWDRNFYNKILNNNSNFDKNWESVDLFFVLAEEFKKLLIELNIKKPIIITSTKVDDRMIKDFKPEERSRKIVNLLFLARVEKNKGIYITIDTFEILSKKFKRIHLKIVGTGTLLQKSKEYCLEKKLKNVTFTGPLKGKELVNEYSNSHIYILPTNHGEGMPTTVLEAMAFGLPVITRPVGGIIDFFEHDRMGALIDSLTPLNFANAVENLIVDKKKWEEISFFNHNFAKKHFMASNIAKYLERIISEI